MNKAPQPEPTPALPDPVRVPQATDPDQIEAKRRRMQDEFKGRRGRESTDLPNAGGPSYSRTALG